ncbi:anti-sigma factor family protein [Paraburkholderia lycopersici]|uniref:Transmembrane transcriptional regulator (Anti-sigma factor RsiW) n=1 Tax=Paraburkholderia lycopersici TaxID=416944 RepID=A0A1G6TKP0_9BURK|nr:anti-sigma factor [Paraburkholderia lycopersici]SDD29643.1 Transmembrane transcriptional regulator (anti-sigma factor RsiW) [Paraburkholderia lycopersici]
MSEQQNPVTQDEIHAYVDGTLSEARRADVERELERNPDLATRASDFFALNNLLHERYDRVLNEPLPARLRIAAPSRETQKARAAANWPRFAGLAATLVLGVGIGWGTHYGMSTTSISGGAPDGGALHAVSADGTERFARQAALAHVVYMPTVARPDTMGDSQEQDFVKWLASRLGTNVHAPMLSRSGFELSGGRLLPGDDGGEVAQFMYHDAQGERVTLCISHRKTSANTTAFKLYQDGPVNVFYWVDGDFGYALSGGIDRKALLQLAHDVYAQLTPR